MSIFASLSHGISESLLAQTVRRLRIAGEIFNRGAAAEVFVSWSNVVSVHLGDRSCDNDIADDSFRRYEIRQEKVS